MPTPAGNKRDFLGFEDLHPGELERLLARAEEFRLLRSVGAPHATRPGHILGLLFDKASTRTRVSFEVAARELGGSTVTLTRNDTQIGRGEPPRDTARVLSRYCHILMVRTFGQDVLEEIARYASVPVVNGLTDRLHPCQVLADLQAVLCEEPARRAPGGTQTKDGATVGLTDVRTVLQSRRYAWVGDGNNMANSWIEAAGLLGLDLALACPGGYDPDAEILARARSRPNARITVVRDAREAVAGRHVISTDVFTSMGQEAETEVRLRAFAGYRVDAALMKAAAPDAIVLHCLPAHRGEEISEEVFEGPQSRVWQQAENRLHAQKAVLEWLLPPPAAAAR